ncbi:MAG: ABC transporter permease [Burkholderiales bacterium]|nr:MAG: ABC transporter permease [Burkholderiales bacterium]
MILSTRRSVLAHAAALAGSGLCLPALSQSDNVIVLGQSAPLTGPAAQLGIQFREGAKLYFNQVNAKGGINGRTVELRTLDDGYEPEKTAANTKKFLSDGVFALFGYIGTPTSVAALPLATEAKTPFFAPFTGAQVLREPFNRYAIHVRASYFDETAAIVKQAASVGIKKFSVFYQNDAYGKAGLEGVERGLKTLNLPLTSTGTVERNTVDVKKAVADILAKQPESIVQIGAYKACAAFIREARAAGFGGTFYNVSFVGTQALMTELGKDARGVVVSQVMPYPYSPNTPLAGEFLEAMKAVSSTNKDISINYSSMEGFVAAKVFVEAMRRAGRGASREAFISAVEGMQNVSMGGFNVNFGANQHTASKYVDLTVLTDDGRVRR